MPFETDLNSWNVTLSPQDLIGAYCVGETIVNLTTHAPIIHDLDDYDEWVFVGKAGFHICIEPQFKSKNFENLVRQLNLSLVMADHPTAFVCGS